MYIFLISPNSLYTPLFKGILIALFKAWRKKWPFLVTGNGKGNVNLDQTTPLIKSSLATLHKIGIIYRKLHMSGRQVDNNR
jgi:hypothetical protein